jgi:hypothetical protein
VNAVALRRVGVPAGAAAAGAAVALWLAADAGVAGPAAVPEVLRAAVTAVLMFALCGYAPARLLLPASLQPLLPLVVLPLGAATSAIALALVGIFAVPLDVGAFAVPAAGAVAAVVVARRHGLGVTRAEAAGAVAPLLVAALVASIALIPVFRTGFATVVGQNGDAELAVSVAEFLQEARPLEERPELAIDHMPGVWRSKYPIYYSLAGVSRASGLEPYQVLSTQMAVLFGLVALSFFLFARRFLDAAPAAGLAAMAAVALDRIVVYLGIHPFHNQIWGLMLLPLLLVLGLEYLRRPARGTGAALLLVATVGLFAWPLMAPIPLVVLGLAALEIRSQRRAAGESPRWIAALRLPRTRRSLLFWIPLGLLALPFVLAGVAGAGEKIVSAVGLLWPGTNLYDWRGADGFFPFPRFFGIPGTSVLSYAAAFAVVTAGALALRGRPREVARPLLAFGVLALVVAVYFRAREHGDLIHFKDLSFFAPFALAAATVLLVEVLASRRGGARVASAVALAGLAIALVAGAREQIDQTHEMLTREMLELREFSDRLPEGASIRIDLPPDGYQLWARHMLHEHPLSAARPLDETIFPHPPRGRRADYLLARATRPPSRDALPPALMGNALYAIYRMRPSVPGRDRSSVKLVDRGNSGGLD